MHLIKAACDAAQAAASACVHATAFPPAPSIEQYGSQVHHAARNLIVSYLEVGPVAWLALLAVVWVAWRGLGAVWAFLIAFRRAAERRYP